MQLRPPDRAVIESFQAFVTSLPEVLSYFVMSGSDDFLLHIAVADNDRSERVHPGPPHASAGRSCTCGPR